MKRWLIVCLMLVMLMPTGSYAEAVTVSSTALIERAAELDGQTVLYAGEVVGDVFRRGDHAWINVADDANAIGVWAESAMTGTLSSPGRYGQTGDYIEVVGTFHRACRDHGGDLDIHAERITVTKKGAQVQKPVSGVMLILTASITAIDLAILLIYRKRRAAAAHS